MALPRVSGGRGAALFLGGRHHSSVAMTPALLNALSQKGAAIPNALIRTPPSAGPIARLTLMPTLFAATAGDKSDFGTSWGTTACHAGAVRAEPTVTMKLKISRLIGEMRCSQTSTANTVELMSIEVSPKIKKRR